MAEPLAYIFAAGSSHRLGGAANGIPKSLVTVGDARLIDHHLESIVACGVRRIAIVVGYRSGEYQAVVGSHYQGVPIHYVVNDHYLDYGQIHSLRLGAALFDGPTLLINADVYCPVDFYRLLLDSPHENVMLLDPDYPVLTGDEVIIQGRHGWVTGLALGFPPDKQGEFVGINRFGPAFLAGWCRYVDRTFADQWRTANYEWVLDGYLKTVEGRATDVGYVAVTTTDWVNVNYPDDLVTVRRLARESATQRAGPLSPWPAR